MIPPKRGSTSPPWPQPFGFYRRGKLGLKNCVNRFKTSAWVVLVGVLFSLASSFQASAQQPCFQVISPRSACVPCTIIVRSCVVGTTPYYIPDSTNRRTIINGNPTGVDTIVYTIPGTYRLGQGILAGGQNRELYTKVYALPNDTIKATLSACSGLRLNVSIQNIEGQRYIIDYGDGRFDTTAITTAASVSRAYQYRTGTANPASVRITSLYGCSRAFNQQVLLLPFINAPDSAWVSQQPDSRWQVRFFGQGDRVYRLGMRIDGRFSPLAFQRENGSTIIFTPPIDDPSEYEVIADDNCGNPIDTLRFNTFNIQGFAENDQMRLTTNRLRLGGTDVFRMRKNGILFYIGVGDTIKTTFVDEEVRCGQQYCYQSTLRQRKRTVLGRFMNYEIRMQPVCLVGVSTRNPAQIRTLSVSTNHPTRGAFLSWKAPAALEIRRFTVRRVTPRGFENLGTPWADSTTQTRINDPGEQLVNTNYCYQVRLMDSCGNYSAFSPSVCPMRLTASRRDEFQYELTWTPLTGWSDGGVKEYLVQIVTPDGVAVQNRSANRANRFNFTGRYTQDQFIRFRIAAVPQNPEIDTAYSNVEVFTQQSTLMIPTAFSPNNDGINDRYVVQGYHLREFEITIVNRWGVRVYYSTNTEEGWDGTVDGKRAPVDVYYVQIKAKDDSGQEIERSQAVTLLR